MSIDKQIEDILSNPEKCRVLVKAMLATGVFNNIIAKTKEDFDVTCDAYIDISMQAEGSTCDKNKFSEMSDYNNFETLEEASRWAQCMNAMHKLRLIANHLNQGWQPDWNNQNDHKYSIYWDHANHAPDVDFFNSNQHNQIFFNEPDTATKAIEMMGDKSLKDLFMVGKK